MAILIVQRTALWFRRHFLCWHVWRMLKWHGLPNEPLLMKCGKCEWITYG